MLIGILLKIASAFAFTIMAALIRAVGDAVPVGEVVFARNFFAIFPILVWLAWRREVAHAVKTQNVRGHIVRGTVGVIAMFTGFAALARLPLPDATALGYASPLITVILAALLLGEKVRIYRWSAVIAGLMGVFVILWPHLAGGALMAALSGGADASRTGEGVVLALANALFTAGAMIQVRRLTQTESTAAIVFFFSVFAAFVGLLTLPLGWTMPDAGTAGLLIAIGVLGGIGQILLTQSYRFADASLIAPFEYTTILWALILGFIMFGDVPDSFVIVGSIIIMASGIAVIWRERQLGIERRLQRKVTPPPGR